MGELIKSTLASSLVQSSALQEAPIRQLSWVQTGARGTEGRIALGGMDTKPQSHLHFAMAVNPFQLLHTLGFFPPGFP